VLIFNPELKTQNSKLAEMEYNFLQIEKKWQKYWADKQIFKAEIKPEKPKYYVLDMFPYPSGAGLHVGHPLGYIASDIMARFKRSKGYNVLHPMGYDAFGLPAEQYAIQTGQHPAITTNKNLKRYREQLDNIGFSFDWSKEIRTCNADYYKWTQWIFLKLFGSWYNNQSNKAETIESLVDTFAKEGNKNVNAATDYKETFSAADWNGFSEKQQQKILLEYRLAFITFMMVNWCPGLGSVLSNEEVKDGVSERGGFPVERKEMAQWCLRITAYADRLLQDLDLVDWPEPVKEMQRNWIGKSLGTELDFPIVGSDEKIKVFTTRIDTTFGVTYLSLAPEHPLIEKITTPQQAEKVKKYIHQAKNRSERDRMSDVKTISGEFTGAYVINPFTNEQIPVWIADYVLWGYGTGAVMAVPSSDTRDYGFAKHFNLPIIAVQEGAGSDITKDDFDPKAGTMINSGFLNGMLVKDALPAAMKYTEENGWGKIKVNFKMRDAIFSRQRYWGEPVPVYFKDGLPYPIQESELPLLLPEIQEYKPTETGEPPLGRAKDWKYYPTPTLPKGEGGIPKNYLTDKATWFKLKEFARDMRKNPTPQENTLWQKLRKEQVSGYKFRRQHAVYDFIVDFINLDKGLVIEIDGAVHDTQEAKIYDNERTKILNEFGLKVIRFTNSEIEKEIEAVLQKIEVELNSLPDWGGLTTPSPLGRAGVGSTLEQAGVGSISEGAKAGYSYELSTMPGWAGSSWYFFRYMDPKNENRFVGEAEEKYWNEVDLYIGGSEHATGHLLYSRFWNKFLYDYGLVTKKEPFKKMINQGMIQGRSNMIYKEKNANVVVCKNQLKDYAKENNLKINEDFIELYVDVNLVDAKDNISIENVIKCRHDLHDAKFEFSIDELGNKVIHCDAVVEKMSKSKLNVVNPDDIVSSYGADTLRLYEMFLGPLEQFKPWNTNSIDGVARFLRKLWRLFYDDKGSFLVVDDEPTKDELKVLHKTIKRVEEDIERFSFNTNVSTFMICVNELAALKCHKKQILEDLIVMIAPYAPHICEELYSILGHSTSISYAIFPIYNAEHVTEDSFEYPISINGKTRHKMTFSLTEDVKNIEAAVIADEHVLKYLEGKTPKKVIIVPKRIVNVVV
jgi:leucyl-tRNA synthetase/very-short-patch-repair endonuclease